MNPPEAVPRELRCRQISYRHFDVVKRKRCGSSSIKFRERPPASKTLHEVK